MNFTVSARSSILTASILLGSAPAWQCAREQPRASPAPTSFSDHIAAAPGFLFADSLSCEVVRATEPVSVGTHYQITGAQGATARMGVQGGKVLKRIQVAPGRVVFQSVGEDPGSVDTVSIDTTTGEFARQWSGWTLTNPELGAGAQRGLCRQSNGTGGEAK